MSMNTALKNKDIKTLIAHDIKKEYRKTYVVKGVDLKVAQGEIVGLLGPNGAGKTTTFYMITGLIKANDGDIYINETPLTKMPMYLRARMGIGYLAQEASIFRRLTTEENLIAILETQGLTRHEINMRTEELLTEFSITHIAKRKAYMLSGGERRRTEIARALCSNPAFLLMDEPFAGIDPIAVLDIQKMIMHLKKRDIGVLITDHNVRETLKITDRSYIMYDGKIRFSGTPKELIENKEARKIYLGQDFTM